MTYITPVKAQETRALRIRSTFSDMKVKLIESFEQLYERKYRTEGFDALAGSLRKTVGYHSAKWAQQAMRHGLRLYRDDFESVMWEEAWLFLQSGRTNPRFYLLEQLELRFKSRAMDLWRWAKRNKRKVNLEADPLPDHGDNPIVDPTASRFEDHVADLELVTCLLNEPSLSDDERQLLRFMYLNHDATYEEMAGELGLPHRVAAWRRVDGLRRKLAWFDPDKEHRARRGQAGKPARWTPTKSKAS